MDIGAEVMGYIAEIGRIPAKDMHMGIRIYNSGVISSLKLIELMSHIEKQYEIAIRPEELIEDNFRDIGAIVGFISFKVKEAKNIA
jgi:acyl carrier protein